ncbi:glycerol-3-phosphate responsive antiterminator [Streptomyces sp. NPDC059740]|uniref:glycerol-3-phosphate responsive antiterminator n=1 Tax=Streptomyces sp. NPDC059740 TaxID=3346926 RepID=UPI00365651A0
MQEPLSRLLEDHPVVASVKDDEDLRAVLRSDCSVVFLLYGTLLNLPDLVRTLKDHGKTVFVNVDLLEGFGGKEIVVTYVRERTVADGVLSSKAHMVRAAREQGLFAVHRFFLIDSLSYRNLARQVRLSKADCVEILPGCMPRVIGWVVADIEVPLIAGGLVCDRDDVFAALGAGAAAVASSNHAVWEM